MIKKLFKGHRFKFIALAVMVVTVVVLGFAYMRKDAKAVDCGPAPSFPAFNIWPLSFTPTDCQDLPMISVRKVTPTATSYPTNANATVTVSSGDTVRVRLYMHNGASPTDQTVATARNVSVATSDDQGSAPGATHTISAAFSASNANSAFSFDANHGGDAVIKSSDGSPITLSQTGSVTACITKQFADQKGIPETTTCGTGADGSPMYSYTIPGTLLNNSVSFGDLPACFPFATFITFDVTVNGTTPSNATLAVTKLVRNVTTNGTFAASANANPNDIVEFQVKITNTDQSTTATAVNVSDTMDSALQYIPGSITSTTNFQAPDSLINGSFNAGDIPATVFKLITFRAKATTAGTFTNTVTAKGSNTNSQSASATVNVATINPTQGAITINKTVKNVTTGQGTLGSTKSVNASTNDTVMFQIDLNVIGGTANNVNVTDQLPNGLQFVAGSVTFNGSPVSDNLLTGTSNPGNLAPGTYTYQFQAKVTAAQITSQQTLTNTTNMTSASGNGSSQASVVLGASNLATGSIQIAKTVRNMTSGQGALGTAINNGTTSVNANTNDTVMFQVMLVVTGSNGFTANNVNVTDQLPSGLQFIPGTVTFNGSSASDNLVTGVSNPGNLTPGTYIYQFQVRVSAAQTSAQQTFTNTANVTSSAGNGSSQASVILNATNPTTGSISLQKTVRNTSTGQGTLGTTTSVNASPNDTVMFQVQITVNSATANNVNVTDQLPNGLQFISGSVTFNGSSVSDNLVTGVSNPGNLAPGIYTYQFQVRVIANTSQSLTNTANVTSSLGNSSGNATVIVNAGCTINCGGFAQLSIQKTVRDDNNGQGSLGITKAVNAANGDHVTFQIAVTSTGTIAANNVFVTDQLPNGLTYISGTARVDNNSGSFDQLIGNKVFLGQMLNGTSHTITFDATVNSSGSTTMTNIGQTGADNVGTVQDTATVFTNQVLGTNVNLNFSKSAFNSTRGVDATTVAAVKGDTIIYTLTTFNSGNAPATNFIVTDDLSQVLNYADMVDLGGGTLNGTVISWPAQTIAAGGTMTERFTVRVKNSLPAGSLSIVNTYGNTVTIHITQPQVLGAIFVAPKTGATASVGFAFAAAVTLLFAIVKRKGLFAAMRKAMPKIRIE